nr:hypothetical protein [uncultured Roseateles sp.]
MFRDVTLQWEGRTYTVGPDRVLPAIAKVEEVVTLMELTTFASRGDLPFGKLAMAFGVLLRHAGATVTDAEVYTGMFRSGDAQSAAYTAIQALLVLMVPPDLPKLRGDSKNAEPAAAPAATSSRKKRTASP